MLHILSVALFFPDTAEEAIQRDLLQEPDRTIASEFDIVCTLKKRPRKAFVPTQGHGLYFPIL